MLKQSNHSAIKFVFFFYFSNTKKYVKSAQAIKGHIFAIFLT